MTNTINRQLPPKLKEIQKINIVNPVQYQLDNNIPVHLFNLGEQDVVMFKLLFKAGRWHENKRLISRLTNRMLREGTSQFSAEQIASKIEYYGANFQTSSNKHFAELSLYTITKNLPHLLPILKDILTNSIFPEQELETIIRNSKQKLLINSQKNEYIADHLFNQLLFGKEHAYGYPPNVADFDAIQVADLQKFYQERYVSNNCTVYIAGKIDDHNLGLVNQYFGQNDWTGKDALLEQAANLTDFIPQKKIIEVPKSVQASIRIGMPLFNRAHSDYAGMSVLNTILGGYFGSRLSNNLREEKGYTYGIHSYLSSQIYAGFFVVSTEVDTSVSKQACHEIFLEINRLQNDLVLEKELKMVQNYLLGSLLSNMNGAFNLVSAFQRVHVHGLNNDFYHQLVETIKTITPEQLRDLAQQYLHADKMLEVVVG